MTELADSVRIIWRAVQTHEAPIVHAVHLEALAGMDQGLVRPDTLDHFVAHTGRLGTILGGFAEGTGLVAFGVLGVSSGTATHMAQVLAIDTTHWHRFVVLDGAASLPAWRGQNLHRELIRARLEHAEQIGRTLVGATVAPGNIPSLRGLLSMDFRIQAFAMLYGGLPRLVVKRDLLAPAPSWKLEHKVPVADIHGHEHALKEGLVGFGCSENEDGAWIIHYGSTVPAR
jgi:GNAT superfamily N-acetyltransferase